jgi:hypothetical protein
VPAGRSVRTLLPGGTVETLGLYVVKWYGIAKTGLDAINTGVDAILDVFTPGLALATTDGDTVRVRSLPAPYAGQIIPPATASQSARSQFRGASIAPFPNIEVIST